MARARNPGWDDDVVGALNSMASILGLKPQHVPKVCAHAAWRCARASADGGVRASRGVLARRGPLQRGAPRAGAARGVAGGGARRLARRVSSGICVVCESCASRAREAGKRGLIAD